LKWPFPIDAIGAFAIARDRDYYRQERLDVQLVLIPSALGMQALLGGNINFPPPAVEACCRFYAARR